MDSLLEVSGVAKSFTMHLRDGLLVRRPAREPGLTQLMRPNRLRSCRKLDFAHGQKGPAQSVT